MRYAFASGIVALLSMPLVTAVQNQPFKFEVVSVKQSKSTAISSRLSMTGGRFVATKATLTELVQWAYRLPTGRLPYRESQIIGAPAWMGMDVFDVEAKIESSFVMRWLEASSQSFVFTI